MASFTIQQAFELAVQHHQAGRLHDAEQIYRQILAQQPQHVDALNNLGLIANQVRRNDVAVDLIRRAIALKSDYPEAYCNLGNVLRDAGQLAEAISACRQAIGLRADFPEAHNNLGNALRDAGQLDEAISACRHALALRPNFPEAHNNLGNALSDKGQLGEAIAAYRQAVALRHNFPEALCSLGIALMGNGQLDEAIAACRQAIALAPNFAEAHSNLGSALKERGQFDEAVAAYRQAIAFNPNLPQVHINLGDVLKEKGLFGEAVAAYRQAIVLRPNHAQSHSDFGIALARIGQVDQAIAAFHQAIALNPNLAEAHNNLGVALKDKGQLDEAVAAYLKAVALKPDLAEGYSNLGNALAHQGKIDEALAAHRQAITIDPHNASIDSNLVLSLHYHAVYDAQAVAEEHRRWNRQHAQPLKIFIQPHANDRNPQRRLRVGYVSPDFHEHPGGRNVLALLGAHDPAQVEIFCYADVANPDAITERIRSYAHQWRGIFHLSDEQLAEQIRHDRIDILVDLAGHTGRNRLLVFAVKPAPVQVTWLGYPNTTGLETMDYRLTDALADPPGTGDAFHSERLIHLPGTAWCFQSPQEHLPLDERISTDATTITFGSFNNFSKITTQMLELWARILGSTPGSKLSIKAKSLQCESTRQRVRQIMETSGVTSPLLELLGWRKSHEEHLATYRRVDIALDTFPYHGTTTTRDALWMGVPVVTLAGSTHVSRVGVSLLTNMGLAELIAESPEEYVRIAVELANDPPRLRNLRATLRRRMEQSPLMDAPKFARNIEAAYHQMWHKWCKTVSSTS